MTPGIALLPLPRPQCAGRGLETQTYQAGSALWNLSSLCPTLVLRHHLYDFLDYAGFWDYDCNVQLWDYDVLTAWDYDLMQDDGYHGEGVADPQAMPSRRAGGNGEVLAVDSHRLGGRLAHGAATDVPCNLLLGHGHHGNGRRRGQPVRLVVAAGEVTHVVGVAVEEGHGAETGQAGPSQTWADGGGQRRSKKKRGCCCIINVKHLVTK